MIETDPFVATVTFYNPDKQFGFADWRGQRIFFHQSACREVDGTPEDPQLTNRHSDRESQWYRGCRYSERIVVKTTMRRKGLKAVAWGFVPVRTWLEDLLHFEMLKSYDGGKITIGYSRREHGDFHRQSEGTLTAMPQLTPGDPWTLRVTYDAYDGPYRSYGECSGREDITFSLSEARPTKRLPYGRYAMDVFVPDAREWAHIVFTPAQGK